MCQRLKTSKPNQVTPGLDKHPSGTVTGGAPRIRLALMKRMTPVEQANQALQQVKDAGSGKTALELGWIEQIRITPPRAVFRLSLPGFAQSQRDRIVAEAQIGRAHV